MKLLKSTYPASMLLTLAWRFLPVRWSGLVAGYLILVSALLASGQLFAMDIAQLKASPYFQQLEQRARSEKIRVIVEAKLNHSGMTNSDKRNKGRELLKAFIRLKGLKEESSIDGTSLLVYEVDAKQLDILTSSNMLENIVEDNLNTLNDNDVEDNLNSPNLLESMALINGNLAHSFNMKGNAATVAILDTGVYKDHPMLAGRVIAEACFSSFSAISSGESLCPNGTTSQYGDGAAMPCSICAHGTQVASIAAGANVDSYGPGVAPEANIIAIQVFTKFSSTTKCAPATPPCLGAYDSDIVKALNYLKTIAAVNNLAAINISLGSGKYTSYCTSSSLNTPINDLRGLGVLTVISSGNSGYSNGVASPACVSGAISVGSTKDNSDVVSSFSNSASILDMLAPGESITAASGTGYGTSSGTSFAAPHVTGAIALLKGFNPGYSAQIMEDLLKQNAVAVIDARNGLSFPRLDVGKMTQAAAGPAYVPSLTINQPITNAIVNKDYVVLSATANDNQDGDISTNIIWKSNIDGVITSPASLSVGTHILTATISDSTGFTTNSSVTVTAKNAPITHITSPTTNLNINAGQAITLSGTANDNEDGNISYSIQWSSNISGNLGTGASINTVLPLGNHTITATVVDNDGLTPTIPAVISINVLCNDCDADGMSDAWETQFNLDNPAGDEDNDTISNLVEFQNSSNPRDAAPLLQITSPGSTLITERPAILSAQAIDAEDGNLSNVVQWSSNIEGNLGTGNNLSHNFAVGTHIISATVTDSQGASPVMSASITVHVGRLGDINDDQLINIMDLLLLEKHLSGSSELSDAQRLRSDLFPPVQGDENITVQDLLLLQKKLIE